MKRKQKKNKIVNTLYKKKMKTLKFFLMATAITSLTSCLNNEDTYTAGFYFYQPSTSVTAVYANNVSDTIKMVSYGNWTVANDIESGSNWCTLANRSGMANTLYTIPVTFKQNATGESRYARILFTDVNHPTEGKAAIFFWQYATRGNGAMGNAPDVKAITGTDGSSYELTYDEQHRPLSLRMTADGSLVRSLTLNYNDQDSTLTVADGSTTLRGTYGNDYQPNRLIGDGDTIAYFSQYYDNGMPVSANNAFRLDHYKTMGDNTYYSFLLSGQSLAPDSLHCADSLRIAYITARSASIEKYKLTYSTADNRCQSIDVNQLILGINQCDPYQLLSLFRYTRSTSIVSTMESDFCTYEVTVSLNSDKSVAQMTVVRTETTMGIGTPPMVSTVTYTFQY